MNILPAKIIFFSLERGDETFNLNNLYVLPENYPIKFSTRVGCVISMMHAQPSLWENVLRIAVLIFQDFTLLPWQMFSSDIFRINTLYYYSATPTGCIPFNGNINSMDVNTIVKRCLLYGYPV